MPPSAAANTSAPGAGAAAILGEMQNSRPVRVWDVALSIVLLLGMFGAVAVALMLAIFLPMVSDGCGAGCNVAQIEAGFILAMALPVLVALAALTLTIVFLVRRRLAYWVPLAGILFVVIGWLIGAAIAMTAVPGFFG